jgi:hypothetical protein
VLQAVAANGVNAITDAAPELGRYLETATDVDPDSLTRDEALAYWINLYNALALDLAGRAHAAGEESVLGIGSGFSRPVVEVGGESLSLDGIEHGKIRRFGDPRIHAALVCGSLSCPTLRHEPFSGSDLDQQLEDQMRDFLAAGGARIEDETLRLSRVFLWYGADFVRPHRMPTLVPASKRAIARALARWMEPAIAEQQKSLRVGFQTYDWGLGCAVSPKTT